jgi:hypothetical protein
MRFSQEKNIRIPLRSVPDPGHLGTDRDADSDPRIRTFD